MDHARPEGRRPAPRVLAAGLGTCAFLALAACAGDPALPAPSSPDCAEVRAIAGSRVADADGAPSPTEAAGVFLDDQDVEAPASDQWVTTADTGTAQTLEWGALAVRVERTDRGWFVENVQECVRRR